MSVFIIAEIGVNHNGSLKMALELIDQAAAAGVDAVKFQTFVPEAVISQFAPKANYQKATTGAQESQLEMVRKLKLSVADHHTLLEHAQLRKVEFLSSPFDLESIALLRQLHLKRLKIPSGEITNPPYLVAAARTHLPLILSTGMSTLQEIEQALTMIGFALSNSGAPRSVAELGRLSDHPDYTKILQNQVTLLHCTTEYPAPVEEVNLAALATMRARFGLPVGYSDHTDGIHISLAAVALGAVVIEKHITLDRNLPGPDHRASLEPAQLRQLVAATRDIECALGDGVKRPMPSEQANALVARKSLVALREILPGEPFNTENLGIKRPGSGISALSYWDYLQRTATRHYQPDQLIE